MMKATKERIIGKASELAKNGGMAVIEAGKNKAESFADMIENTVEIVKLGWKQFHAEEKGSISAGALIEMIVGAVIIGALIVALWPTFAGTDTDIQAMTTTDGGTTFLQDWWPVILIIAGIAVGVGVLRMILKKTGVIGD